MESGGRKSVSVEWSSRQLFGVVFGGLLLLLTVFLAGFGMGKKSKYGEVNSVSSLDQRQLDCLDWLQQSNQKKTAR